MKILRKLKLFFVPEYKITMRPYVGEYEDKPKNMTEVIFLMRDNMKPEQGGDVYTKYKICCTATFNAALEAKLIRSGYNYYFIAHGFTDAINDYTITEVKD